MIAIRKLSWLALVVLSAALAACGSDSNDTPATGGGGGGGGGAGGPQSVELAQLEGSWAGPFDSTVLGSADASDMQTLRINITGEQIEYPDFPDLTGTVSEASEVSNAFRISVTNGSDLNLSGMVIVIPGNTPHMLYLHENGQVAALQKLADGAETPEVPSYAQTDIDGAWDGLTVKANDPQFSALLQTTSSASCEASDSASDCTVTIDETSSITGATKEATALTLDGEGRWVGTYGDAGTARILIPADKSFAGAWLCEDGTADGFPQSCDFSAWTRGSAE